MKYLLPLIFVSFLFLNCSSEDVAGTVTDTGNTIAYSGVVKRSDGNVATGAIVRLARILPESEKFNLPEFRETATDSLGLFYFDSLIADTFQLAVLDTEYLEIAYTPQVSNKEELENIKLDKAALFRSVLYYEEVENQSVAVGSHFRVYVPSTPFFQSVFAGDSFSMMLPSGNWWFGFKPSDTEMVNKLQDSGVPDSLINRVWNFDKELKAGDTISAGPFIWSTKKNIDSLLKEEEKIQGRIAGQISCAPEIKCEEVEVQLITDLFGFEFRNGDSIGFIPSIRADKMGRWVLPAPREVPFDSFRVEFRYKSGVNGRAGYSRYVKASEIKNLKDTLFVGEDSLLKMSGLISGVNLVVDKEDTNQVNNCMVNSVVVGIKGTSHFVRDITCNPLKIFDLPAGEQEIVLYTGDPKVIGMLQDNGAKLENYVTLIQVVLPEGEPLAQQWMVYTPPKIAR